MNAIDYLMNISSNEHLSKYPFKYCLASKSKIPFTVEGKLAHPNNSRDFVDLDKLINCKSLDKYAGIGISIQASNICAIDVDHCFKEKYDITSGDSRAKDILKMFKDIAYIEFSFSGKGLRILFSTSNIDNYEDKYYIKNTKTGIEYYQPANSARYVTLTGKTIYDNSLYLMSNTQILFDFLNKYMLKNIKANKIENNENVENLTETRSLEQLMKIVRKKYVDEPFFQEMWFNTEHYLINGLSQESDSDFALLKYLYEKVTKDETLLRLVFEQSPYFKSKDTKHLKKWSHNNYRYYNFMFKRL